MLYLWACCKRDQRIWSGSRGHEVHQKTEELLRKILTNALMHSVRFYSLAGPSYMLLTEEDFAK